MLVSDVSRFDVVLPSVDLDYQIGDVLEFDVICVRAVAAAPEGVESDEVFGQLRDGVIDDFNTEAKVLPQLIYRPIGVKGPCRAELRFVHLYDEIGIGDGLVFLTACFRHRHHVLFFAAVMSIVHGCPQTEGPPGPQYTRPHPCPESPL